MRLSSPPAPAPPPKTASLEAPPVLRLIGAAPLAALMAAARVELGRERASSRCADALNSALACGSAPQARVERR